MRCGATRTTPIASRWSHPLRSSRPEPDSSSSVETSSGVGAVALAKAPSGARVPAFRLCLWLAGEGGAGSLDLRRRGSRTKGGALKRAFREPFEALLMSLRQLDSYFH